MTQVKICGLTCAEDMEAALDSGADYVGIVREPSSPRYVENPDDITSAAVGRAPIIGVYGPYYEDGYVQVFDGIQTISKLAVPNLLKVVRFGHDDVDNAVEDLTGPALLDAYHASKYGGSGKSIDWDIARIFVEKSPYPVFLAGGLTPDNVADAIRNVRPYCVDVSSGVEVEPGRKDHGAVRAFIEAAKSV